MSTATRRRRVRRLEQTHRRRSRAEITRAVVAGVSIVAFTVFGIWLLRPGGLANRQPRATWLVGLALAAVIVIVALAVRPERTERQRRVWVPAGLGAVMVVALVVWLSWPGGIIVDSPDTPAFDTSELDLSELDLPELDLPEPDADGAAPSDGLDGTESPPAQASSPDSVGASEEG